MHMPLFACSCPSKRLSNVSWHWVHRKCVGPVGDDARGSVQAINIGGRWIVVTVLFKSVSWRRPGDGDIGSLQTGFNVIICWDARVCCRWWWWCSSSWFVVEFVSVLFATFDSDAAVHTSFEYIKLDIVCLSDDRTASISSKQRDPSLDNSISLSARLDSPANNSTHPSKSRIQMTTEKKTSLFGCLPGLFSYVFIVFGGHDDIDDDAFIVDIVVPFDWLESIINTRARFDNDSCECCTCFRSVLCESMGVAGGELVSTLVVSRMVISAENERPQGQLKRGLWLSFVIDEFEAKIG